MFESKHDSNVIADVGRKLAATGGRQSMNFNFYNYNVITATMCVKAGMPANVYAKWWGDARVEINKAVPGLVEINKSSAWDGVSGPWRRAGLI